MEQGIDSKHSGREKPQGNKELKTRLTGGSEPEEQRPVIQTIGMNRTLNSPGGRITNGGLGTQSGGPGSTPRNPAANVTDALSESSSQEKYRPFHTEVHLTSKTQIEDFANA